MPQWWRQLSSNTQATTFEQWEVEIHVTGKDSCFVQSQPPGGGGWRSNFFSFVSLKFVQIFFNAADD